MSGAKSGIDALASVNYVWLASKAAELDLIILRNADLVVSSLISQVVQLYEAFRQTAVYSAFLVYRDYGSHLIILSLMYYIYHSTTESATVK